MFWERQTKYFGSGKVLISSLSFCQMSNLKLPNWWNLAKWVCHRVVEGRSTWADDVVPSVFWTWVNLAPLYLPWALYRNIDCCGFRTILTTFRNVSTTHLTYCIGQFRNLCDNSFFHFKWHRLVLHFKISFLHKVNQFRTKVREGDRILDVDGELFGVPVKLWCC